MKNKVYTLEEEDRIFEQILRNRGIQLNNNYFRANRGYHPFFQKIISIFRNLRVFLRKTYFLIFTDDQLILMHKDHSNGSIDDNIIKIEYDSIDNFDVVHQRIYYRIQFEYDNEEFYFYIDADGVLSIRESEFSRDNFHTLKDDNFMGLLSE